VAYGGVWDITVSGYLVGRIDDDDTFFKIIGQHAGGFAQDGGLANARWSHQQHIFTRLHQVLDYHSRAHHGASHAAGKPDDFALAVADSRYAVQGACEAGAVITAEGAYQACDVLDISIGYLVVTYKYLAAGKTGFRQPAEVHDNLQQFAASQVSFEIGCYVRGHNGQK
jgi:hypothetical protein